MSLITLATYGVSLAILVLSIFAVAPTRWARRRASRTRPVRLPRPGRVRVGGRVVAVVDVREDEIVVLGEGTYAGTDRPPDRLNPHAFGRLGSWWRHRAYLRYREPKILLDSGLYVWSAELVWWGPADQLSAWRGLRGLRVSGRAPEVGR